METSPLAGMAAAAPRRPGTSCGGAEDVAVPLLAGDRIGDRRLDDQHLAVLLGHRQHRESRGETSGADGEIDLVVVIGLLQQRLGEIGLQLIVLDDHVDLAAADRHRALGEVFEPHHEAGFGLLGVSLERSGLAGDQSRS